LFLFQLENNEARWIGCVREVCDRLAGVDEFRGFHSCGIPEAFHAYRKFQGNGFEELIKSRLGEHKK